MFSNKPSQSMSDPVPVIEAQGIGKLYNRRWALRNVNIKVFAGERVLLWGPNGSGKTSLLRILATLSRASRGELKLFGLEAIKYKRDLRNRIGYLGHNLTLYDDLTARENLNLYSKLYSVKNPENLYMPLIYTFGLVSFLDSRVRNYSRGMQQKLAIVKALIHQPEILLLDEPSTGLDAESTHKLEEVLAQYDGTIVFSSHDIEFGLSVGNRVLVLSNGSIIADKSVQEIDSIDLQHPTQRHKLTIQP